MRAYILVKTDPQYTIEVYDALKKDKYVTEAAVIHGPFDCIGLVERARLADLNSAVMRIREIEGVKDTTTCIVMQSFRRQVE
ncbi:MAG TPA: Lrp/AsnC ligand binding domain-containing protein [Aggregatilineales bacterium]|nr:Lrp/AsnC ligand binding domain-containing protein [Aggregatilineales bacterium]